MRATASYLCEGLVAKAKGLQYIIVLDAECSLLTKFRQQQEEDKLFSILMAYLWLLVLAFTELCPYMLFIVTIIL